MEQKDVERPKIEDDDDQFDDDDDNLHPQQSKNGLN